MSRKVDLAIINRSFWPIYPVIGEALLRLAERQATRCNVAVIMQDHADIRAQLAKHHRGQGVDFYPCKSWSGSASGIFRRIADAVFFMCWVLGVLLWTRPAKVYVSTDPPVVVPFIVMLYCRVFSTSYVYHLQDIHPEATNVVVPVNKVVYRVLRALDSMVMRHAESIITITAEMAEEIRTRSATHVPIFILSNPSVSFDEVEIPENKIVGFSFSGNAGRLQRIPLIIDAIKAYSDQGGKLPFVFAGGGIYTNELKKLATKYENVQYLGVISPKMAAQVNADYQWALLPIEDEVTRFAFPSKSSSYVFSGTLVAAVCGVKTSVAEWVQQHRVGVVISPDVPSLCEFFRKIESSDFDLSAFDYQRDSLKEKLDFDFFISQLEQILTNKDAAYV